MENIVDGKFAYQWSLTVDIKPGLEKARSVRVICSALNPALWNIVLSPIQQCYPKHHWLNIDLILIWFFFIHCVVGSHLIAVDWRRRGNNWRYPSVVTLPPKTLNLIKSFIKINASEDQCKIWTWANHWHCITVTWPNSSASFRLISQSILEPIPT